MSKVKLRRKEKTPFAGYSGSCCQVKVDESPDKGVLSWEWNVALEKHTPRFVGLKNDYGVKTFEIEDLDKFNISTIKIPTNKYVCRLLYTGDEENFTITKFNELKRIVKGSISNQIITQQRFRKRKTIKEQAKIVNKHDYFSEYFKSKDTNPELIGILKELDKNFELLIDTTDYQVGQYSIEELEISNFLCFGEYNVIDFTKLPGLIGLFQRNRSGKTSIFNSLTFCLFNKTPKDSDSVVKLINDQLDPGITAYVQVRIVVSGVRWRIKRTIIPNELNTGAKVKVEVYEEIDGVEVARHEENRIQTNNRLLKKLLGDEQIFFTTVLCTDKNSQDFVDVKNSERLDLIIKFLGIALYDQKYKLCDEELKKQQTIYGKVVDDFKKLKSKTELLARKEELKQIIEENLTKKGEVQTRVDELIKRNRELEEKKNKLNFQGVNKSEADLEKDKIDQTTSLNNERLNVKDHEEEQGKLYVKWETYSNLRTQLDSWKPERDKHKNKEEDKYKLKIEIELLESQLLSDVCPHCQRPWEVIEKSQIEVEIASKKKQQIEIEKFLKTYKKEVEEQEELKKDIKQYDGFILSSNTKIERIEDKLKEIGENLKILKQNKKKQEKKFEFEQEVNKNTVELQRLQTRLIELNTSIGIDENEEREIDKVVLQYENKFSEVVDLETLINNLTVYKKAMHRNGIPSLILENFIPSINVEINSYISELFDFSIEMELHDKNLEIYYIYDKVHSEKVTKRNITQSSGMEGTIINLAIRAALTKISLLPKPSLLMLDEVFTKLDEENMRLAKELLIRLQSQYQNIILISHLEALQDLPNYFINLEQISGVSQILAN